MLRAREFCFGRVVIGAALIAWGSGEAFAGHANLNRPDLMDGIVRGSPSSASESRFQDAANANNRMFPRFGSPVSNYIYATNPSYASQARASGNLYAGTTMANGQISWWTWEPDGVVRGKNKGKVVQKDFVGIRIRVNTAATNFTIGSAYQTNAVLGCAAQAQFKDKDKNNILNAGGATPTLDNAKWKVSCKSFGALGLSASQTTAFTAVFGAAELDIEGEGTFVPRP